MHIYYLSLGSNLGDREGFLAKAVKGIRSIGRVIAISSVYETDPVGYLDQPAFLNTVLAMEGDLSPSDLLARLKEIESGIGAKADVRYGPRELDIDIILWSGDDVDTPDLTIPHPRMMERAFILIPLADIAADVTLPTGESAQDAAGRIGSQGVRVFSAPPSQVEV